MGIEIGINVDVETEILLRIAAEKCGMDISTFVTKAAIEKAVRLVDGGSIVLSRTDSQTIIAAIEADAKPTPKLLKASKRYNKVR